MERIIEANNLPLGFYAKNRSGYEGSYYLIEKHPLNTITAKSKKFDVKSKDAEIFPIVLFTDTWDKEFLVAKQVGKTWVITHAASSRRSVKTVTRWYQKNFVDWGGRWQITSALWNRDTETMLIILQPKAKENG